MERAEGSYVFISESSFLEPIELLLLCPGWFCIANINICLYNKHMQLPNITPEISLAFITYSQIFLN